jgi:hypothetical protein
MRQLPDRWVRAYRKRKHGRATCFDMYFAPKDHVLAALDDMKLDTRAVIDPADAGALQGNIYLLQRNQS